MLTVEKIKTVQDMQRFVEGCLNDYEAGLSTKEETLSYFKEYTFRIMELCVKEVLSDDHIMVKIQPYLFECKSATDLDFSTYTFNRQQLISMIKMFRHG